MRALLVALALLVATALPASAQQVEISADSFVIDEGSGSATFSGNVVVTRADVTIWADSVVIGYGSGGVEDIDSFDATGSVRIRTADQSATGDRVVFVPETQLLTMSGNVVVENAVGKLTGPQLVINLATNESVFSGGGSSGRVTGVFTPQ